MHGASGEIRKKRPMRVRRSLQANPVDGSLGNVFAHVIIVAAFVRHHRCGLVKHRWFVLAGFSAQDSVKAFEPQACRPAIKRPGEGLLMRGRNVPLTECASRIPVLAQDVHERGGFLRDDAVIAGEGTSPFWDVAHVHGVMIATSEHRGACGRAQCGGVKLIKAQAVSRNTVECRSGNRPAERAARSKAHVVKQHQHDVGRISSW